MTSPIPGTRNPVVETDYQDLMTFETPTGWLLITHCSMHHQDWHGGAAEYVPGEAAEDPLPQTAVAVGAHDNQGALFGGGCEQCVGGAQPVGLQVTGRRVQAMPAESGHQASSLFVRDPPFLGHGNDQDLLRPGQQRHRCRYRP